MMTTSADPPAPLDLLTAGEVAAILRLNPQVVTRKLQAGEIPGYRIGKEWRVDRAQLVAWLETRSNQGRDPAARAGVAQFFGADGALTRIPASRATREKVLRLLVEDVEPGIDHTEAAVSAVLARRHPDTATLRREMVAAGLLRRDAGRYRRTEGPAATRRGRSPSPGTEGATGEAVG